MDGVWVYDLGTFFNINMGINAVCDALLRRTVYVGSPTGDKIAAVALI